MMKLPTKLCHVAILLIALLETKHRVNGGPVSQYFISTPQNTTVTAGHHVRLPCAVGNIVGSCQWTRDGFALGTDRNLAGYSRYHMPSPQDNVCDLTIDPVLPLDEGVYQCQVSGGHGISPISAGPVTLTVNSEPGKPYILNAMEIDMMEVEDGEEVELQCESQGGRPPAEIQWWDGEGRRIVSDVTEHVRRMEDRKTFKTSSTLKFRPSSSQGIKCSAHNDAFPAGKMSHTITMKIKGKPDVELQHLDDGDSVQISCSKDHNKDKVRYKWFINDVELFAETKNVLEIHQFSKSYDKSRIKCSITDQKGQDEVLRLVELVHKLSNPNEAKSFTNNPDGISNTGQRLQHNLEVNREIVKSRKTMITCIVEEETALEPKYVWIEGKLRMAQDEKMDATDGKRKYKCKVIPNGTKKMNRMSTNMKKISRTLRKFSKTLSSLSTTIDDT